MNREKRWDELEVVGETQEEGKRESNQKAMDMYKT